MDTDIEVFLERTNEFKRWSTNPCLNCRYYTNYDEKTCGVYGYNYEYADPSTEFISSYIPYFNGDKHGKMYMTHCGFITILNYKHGKSHGKNLITYYNEDRALLRHTSIWVNGEFIKKFGPYIISE